MYFARSPVVQWYLGSYVSAATIVRIHLLSLIGYVHQFVLDICTLVIYSCRAQEGGMMY